MNPESLLEFPCVFPFKIIGKNSVDFKTSIVKVVTRHAPDFDPNSAEARPSKHGTYSSVTCTVNAVSQNQLNNLYRDLSKLNQVKMVL